MSCGVTSSQKHTKHFFSEGGMRNAVGRMSAMTVAASSMSAHDDMRRQDCDGARARPRAGASIDDGGHFDAQGGQLLGEALALVVIGHYHGPPAGTDAIQAGQAEDAATEKNAWKIVIGKK